MKFKYKTLEVEITKDNYGNSFDITHPNATFRMGFYSNSLEGIENRLDYYVERFEDEMERFKNKLPSQNLKEVMENPRYSKWLS